MQILRSLEPEKRPRLFYICVGAIGCALLYFIINNEIIMYKSPFATEYACQAQTRPIERKHMKLHYWQREAWHYEDVEILWPADDSLKLNYLIGNWLSMLDDELIMDKKVSVQSVIITNNVAFVSFDRNPFSKDYSSYQKLMWTEGLLKTVRENGLKIQAIHFLSHHHPLNDYHLDFSNPWPICGFLE